MQILIEFVISTIVLWLVARATGFKTKNVLSRAHVRSVKQWDRTGRDVWEHTLCSPEIQSHKWLHLKPKRSHLINHIKILLFTYKGNLLSTIIAIFTWFALFS